MNWRYYGILHRRKCHGKSSCAFDDEEKGSRLSILDPDFKSFITPPPNACLFQAGNDGCLIKETALTLESSQYAESRPLWIRIFAFLLALFFSA
jgi:hypothetical protein